MLPEGAQHAEPWFLDALVECAGRVLARSGGGDLVFVGRSLDSMFDLLGGALAEVGAEQRVLRLPLSFQRGAPSPSGRRWVVPELTPRQLVAARELLASVGASPALLARAGRPVTFVDVVSSGSTFTDLFGVLREWVEDAGAPWRTVRRRLRFVGVTRRGTTSPNAFRWQEEAPWTRELSGASVLNVSLDPEVWSWFGNWQDKLTRSYRPDRWTGAGEDPERGERTRQALAEAVALVSYGRSREGRRRIARAVAGEPALSQPWLRSLARRLNG